MQKKKHDSCHKKKTRIATTNKTRIVTTKNTIPDKKNTIRDVCVLALCHVLNNIFFLVFCGRDSWYFWSLGKHFFFLVFCGRDSWLFLSLDKTPPLAWTVTENWATWVGTDCGSNVSLGASTIQRHLSAKYTVVILFTGTNNWWRLITLVTCWVHKNKKRCLFLYFCAYDSSHQETRFDGK